MNIIAKLLRGWAVASGAVLGVMVKMAEALHNLDYQTSDDHPSCTASPLDTPSPETESRSQHTLRNTNHRSLCAGTSLSACRKCNHPENGADVSMLKPADEVEKATKYQERVMKRFRLIALTTIFLLPSLALWMIAKVLPQLSLLPLLLFQGWITMSATVVFFVAGMHFFGGAWLMTPNGESSRTAGSAAPTETKP